MHTNDKNINNNITSVHNNDKSNHTNNKNMNNNCQNIHNNNNKNILMTRMRVIITRRQS